MHCNSRGDLSSPRPMDRRMFLKGAALGLLGLTVLGIDNVAFAANASPETLAALDSAQAEYEAAMVELTSIGAQLEEAQYKLSECQANLDATNQQITELVASIAQTQAELEEAQDVLAGRVKANYESGGVGIVDVIFNATDFDDFVSRLYYAGKINEADEEAIQNVKDLKASLEEQEAQLQEQRAQQEQLLAEQQAYTDELSSTQAYYQEYTASLSAEVTALMEQARQELIAAQQAEYEAYLAQQQAAAQESGGDGSSGDAPSGDGGSSDGGYTDGGSSSGGDWSGTSSGGGSSSGGSVGGGGNHAYSVADIAWSYIGVPYVWGGTDPSGFDCSGLAQYCYAQAGYYISRTTYSQAAEISARGQMKYSMSELQPGDLVFPHSGHVGIYMGGGMMIHAPAPGRSVEYASVYAFSFGGCPV